MESKQPETEQPRSFEEELEGNLKIAEMQSKAGLYLVQKHIRNWTGIMMASNGVSLKEKLLAAMALERSILDALTFGTQLKAPAETRKPGTAWAKEINNCREVMVRISDYKTLLMVVNSNKQEQGENNDNDTETVSNASQENSGTSGN